MRKDNIRNIMKFLFSFLYFFCWYWLCGCCFFRLFLFYKKKRGGGGEGGGGGGGGGDGWTCVIARVNCHCWIKRLDPLRKRNDVELDKS